MKDMQEGTNFKMIKLTENDHILTNEENMSGDRVFDFKIVKSVLDVNLSNLNVIRIICRR